MIRMEYPKANIEGLTDREKIYALKKQLDTLTNNVQLVLESIDGDLEGINEYIGGVPDELDNSVSPISKRVDELETAVGTLEERDYIVEQGTSGNWTYEKWNSGIAECWGRFNTSLSWSAYTVSGLYYNSTPWVIAFPFAITNACATVTCRGVGSNVGWIGNADVTNNEVKVTLLRNGTGGNAYITVNVKGRWK